MKNKVKYVLGFMFSEDKEYVALIKKTKPEWQKGRLNGIGGKVEKDEYGVDAMVREFREETGSLTQEHEWKHFATMTNSQFIVWCYAAYGDLGLLKTTTEEEIVIGETELLCNENVLSNLHWLIPMALDCDKFNIVEIEYKEAKQYMEDGNR